MADVDFAQCAVVFDREGRSLAIIRVLKAVSVKPARVVRPNTVTASHVVVLDRRVSFHRLPGGVRQRLHFAEHGKSKRLMSSRLERFRSQTSARHEFPNT